jgi:hypothetical protein
MSGRAFIIAEMETQAEIRERWRCLRNLLIEQLSRFESGIMQLHANDVDVSAGAIAMLEQKIQDFDELIARSEARNGSDPPAPEHSG